MANGSENDALVSKKKALLPRSKSLGTTLPNRITRKAEPWRRSRQKDNITVSDRKQKRTRISACSLGLSTKPKDTRARTHQREKKERELFWMEMNAETPQVPGGRLGGQDQEGSSTRRSFLCSDSTLLPPAPFLRVLPRAPIDGISEKFSAREHS